MSLGNFIYIMVIMIYFLELWILLGCLLHYFFIIFYNSVFDILFRRIIGLK